MTLEALYNYGNEHGIVFTYFKTAPVDALSVKMDDYCAVAIDPFVIENTADEKCKCAHEVGHCVTDAFYTETSDAITVARCEEKANRWAIKKLVPKDELTAAVADGYKEVWELAEIFNVTPQFMDKALSYYLRPLSA